MSVSSSANCNPQDDTVLLNTQISDKSMRNEQEINKCSVQQKQVLNQNKIL